MKRQKKAAEKEEFRLWSIKVQKKYILEWFENISEEQAQYFAEEYISIPIKGRLGWVKYFQEVKGLKLKEEMKGGSKKDVNV